MWLEWNLQISSNLPPCHYLNHGDLVVLIVRNWGQSSIIRHYVHNHPITAVPTNEQYQCPASQASRPRIVNSATNAWAAANSSAASAAAGAAAVAGTGAGAPVGTEDWGGGLPAADRVENFLSWVQNKAKLKQNVYIYIYTYIHTLHYITLHYITLHYITLHYITYIHTLHYIHTYIHYIHYIHTYITYIHTYIHIYVTAHVFVKLQDVLFKLSHLREIKWEHRQSWPSWPIGCSEESVGLWMSVWKQGTFGSTG